MNYAAALITFVDPKSSEEVKHYCYPVTRVELRGGSDAELQRVFTVIEGGDWLEIAP